MTNPQQPQPIDSYFQTGNEQYDSFAFNLYQEVLREELFDDPEQPLRFCQEQIEQLTANAANPVQAVATFSERIEKADFNDEQAAFLYDRVQGYLETSGVHEEMEQVTVLLHIHWRKVKERFTPPDMIEEARIIAPKTDDLRSTLKAILQQELEQLPQLLAEMESKERVEALLKMMPFVLPKVEAVSVSYGEPMDFNF